MTIKYGRLNNRRPCSQDYRKPREDVRLAEREIVGLAYPHNQLLKRAASPVRYHAVVRMRDPEWFITTGADKGQYSQKVILDLWNAGYLEPIPCSRTNQFRLTRKGRIASDYLNGRRGSYGD